MSWRDNLLPASFRGAPFFVNESNLEGGRRLAAHEFPLRDTAFVEDLGLRNRSYKLTGYVIANGDNGLDYFPDRDALIQALETDDSGTLSHPYLGSLTVNVDKYSCRETLEEGGMAIFDLEFVDTGSNPSPVSGNDTQGANEDQAGNMDDQLGGDFGDG